MSEEKKQKLKEHQKNYRKANRIKKGLISYEFNSVCYVFFCHTLFNP